VTIVAIIEPMTTTANRTSHASSGSGSSSLPRGGGARLLYMNLLAVDDGIWQGNVNLADVFFLFATILAVLAAIAYAVVSVPAARWAPVLLSLAVGCGMFAWLVL